ncbi:putative DMT superfamily transporter inner membrane protein [Streptococcus parauberis]|uniref:Putative DMT superfamily transporter inner membrane protein n=2 Tax=Streptococcus parauberis TaxID=1348 RepID=A0A854WJN1_9STRE|nr:DMT family transporter [Streptococcus parauberis]PCH10709.1 putative DMT superfamily transporter inner membrane protein [Streptococcus parauberis]
MTNNTKKDLIIGSLCAIGCEILFGLSYLFTKEAGQTASALALLGWRFLVAALFLLILFVIGLIRVNFKGKSIKYVLLAAIFSPVLYFLGETLGINLTTASESGAFLASIPVMALIAATLILKEKPSKHQIVGIAITVSGVLLSVMAVGMSASFSVLGYAMLFLAVLSYALYCVYVDKASHFTGVELTVVMILLGFLVFASLAIGEAIVHQNLSQLIILPFENKTFALAILYQGIGCSVLAFFLSNVAIAKIGVNRTASFIGVSTAVAIVFGVLILGESFTGLQIFGVLAIMIGVYTSNKG